MNESLSDRQIMLLLFLYIVGYSIISLPKDIAQNVGTEGWITILVLTCFNIFNGCIITFLGYTHKNMTIYEYSKLLTGRFFAAILVAIYIFHFSLVTFSILRLAGEYIKLEMLRNTPIWAICLLLGLVSYYAVTKKLRVIGRLSEVNAPITIFVYLIIFCLLLTKGKLVNLRPLYGSVDAMTHLKTIVNPAVIVAFIGLEPLAFIPFNEKNTKKTYIYVIISMLLVGFFHLLSVESCIALLGVDDAMRYYDPLVLVIRRIDLQGVDFLQRLDGIFFITWIMSMFYILCCTMYGSTILLSKCLKKVNYQFIAIGVFAVCFIVALIPPTFDYSIKLVNNVAYTGLIVETLIPLVLLIITKVKKYG